MCYWLYVVIEKVNKHEIMADQVGDPVEHNQRFIRPRNPIMNTTTKFHVNLMKSLVGNVHKTQKTFKD